MTPSCLARRLTKGGFFTALLALPYSSSQAQPVQEMTHEFELLQDHPAPAGVIWIFDTDVSGLSTGWTSTSPARVTNVNDNDLCTNGGPGSWVFSDNVTPTLAVPGMGMDFGPGGFVTESLLDVPIISPWISLASFPSAAKTVFEMTLFPGNNFANGRVVTSVSVRAMQRIEDPSPLPGDSLDIVTPWRDDDWYSLGGFAWETQLLDLTHLMELDMDRSIQVRLRASDWQLPAYGNAAPPPFLNPGPGPFVSRVRIGRAVLINEFAEPRPDTRLFAQDVFPTDPSSVFGTCAWSSGRDLGANGMNTALVLEDVVSIDLLQAPGVPASDVFLYARIREGPHTSKVPPPVSGPPYAVVGDFFKVPAVRLPGTDRYTVSLDDDYFRGGDQVVYFWEQTNSTWGSTTFPAGIDTSSPTEASAQAQAISTGGSAASGLLQVKFLPKIDWDPTYLAAIAASPDGKVSPTPAQIANSQPSNEILYVQKADTDRRYLEYTAFQLTLLGTGEPFDVYDLQGYGNTNNDLASRASLTQVAGYKLIIHDCGIRRSGNIPGGLDSDSEKIDQAGWYVSYLGMGATKTPPGSALWLIGENLAEEEQGTPLLTMAGVGAVGPKITAISTELVAGVGSFTFYTTNPPLGHTVTLAGDQWVVDGRCAGQTPLDFDDLSPTGTGVGTYSYTTAPNNFATIMNSSQTDRWSTIVTALAWPSISFSIPPKPTSSAPLTASDHRATGQATTAAAVDFVNRVVAAITGTDTPVDIANTSSPLRTIGYQNSPNPFNPTTTIRFDVAATARVAITVYDIAGHAVRTLVNETFPPGHHSVVWDGRDDRGTRLVSGIYFYRMHLGEVTQTKKMLLVK